jgi:tetratricopeptide (TPR) repeat protein
MNELQELTDLDVSDSMKNNIEALFNAIKSIETENTSEANEKLNQIHSKVVEIEEYFWRPVDSENVYQKLIEISKGLGDEEKASHYEYQIKLRKANELEFKGRVQDFFGNKTEAVKYYEEALELIPIHELALPAKTKALKSIEKAQNELPKIKRKLETNKKEPKLWLKYAVAHMNLGDVKRAIDFFDRVIELNPTDPDAHARRGCAMESLGDYRGAKKYLERALELKPTSMTAKRGLNYAEYFLDH